MSTSAVHPDKERDPQRGDVYESKFGSTYQLIYIDRQIVLLRDKQTDDRGRHYHRQEPRERFDTQRSIGYYDYQPDSELDLFGEHSVDWTNVDLIGEQSAEALTEAGFETKLDVVEADDDELAEIDGIGSKALQNLREFTQ